MLTIGIAYYPLFACMETDYKVTGFTIGFLYSAFWLVNVTSVIYWEKTFEVHISRADNFVINTNPFESRSQERLDSY